MKDLEIKYQKRIFHFKRPSGTSRGVLTEKKSWFLEVSRKSASTIGVGECSIIEGLSPDYSSDEQYEGILDQLCANPSLDLTDYPSIKFGLETALLDLNNGGKKIYFDNAFAHGAQRLPINGLVWMGNEAFMREQIDEKLQAGFTTIKMKIGAIELNEELELLRSIRNSYSKEQITLRVDANGAFSADSAPGVLEELSKLDIHSIEQPLKAGQWNALAELCQNTPVPIALDEELIGINDTERKRELLETVRPQYIILKPSLHGGISGAEEWISIADHLRIEWWITSALESNIGLNAICQFTANYKIVLPQGLGTGSLYTDNIPSDLVVESGYIQLRK